MDNADDIDESIKSLSIYETATALAYPFKKAIPSTELLESLDASNLCLEIALFTYLPGQPIDDRNRSVLSKVLPITIQTNYKIHVPSGILLQIIDYAIPDSAFTWDKCNDKSANKLLEFTERNTKVRFRDPNADSPNTGHGSTIVGGKDYVIVRSKQLLDVNAHLRINVYVKSKGDEMWIGIMDSNYYNHHTSLRRREHAITYYNRGRVHLLGSALHGKILDPYTSGHWLRFDLFLSKTASACEYNMSRSYSGAACSAKVSESFRRYLYRAYLIKEYIYYCMCQLSQLTGEIVNILSN